MKVNISFPFFILLVACCWLSGCSTIEVFEKNASIPGHKWQSGLQPVFYFSINDTSTLYNMYVVLRHTDAYRYNNIWLNIGSKFPGGTMRSQRFDLQLGSDINGWEGTGMGDIWELRKPVTHGPVKFAKPGTYQFMIAQAMRDNPLAGIISIGVRVEKVK